MKESLVKTVPHPEYALTVLETTRPKYNKSQTWPWEAETLAQSSDCTRPGVAP